MTHPVNYFENPTYIQQTTKNINDMMYILNEKVPDTVIVETMQRMMHNKKFDETCDEDEDNVKTIVMMNIRKLDYLWSTTDHNDTYIAQFNDIKYLSDRLKYLNSRRDLILNKINNPPEASWCSDLKMFSFYDGRNRFANMRDLGYVEMPIAISKKDLHTLNNYNYDQS